MELLLDGHPHSLAGEVLIGSDPAAGLRLGGPGVLPRHAVLRSRGDGMVVITTATAGAEVLVNGTPLGAEPTPVLHGDKVRIAGHELQVSDPARAGATRRVAAQGAPADARLISLQDGREYPVRAALSMGRDAGSDVVVEDADASRRHAEILREGAGWVLVDRSTNGTRVNGEPVMGRHALQSGDVVAIGAEEFRFRAPPGAPAPAEPAAPAPTPGVPPPGVDTRLNDTMFGVSAFTPPPASRVLVASDAPVLASFLIRSGSRKGERIGVRAPVVHLGRGEYNEVHLPEPSVSQSHATLQLRGGVWILTDLGSTNGSFVDGERLGGNAEQPVPPGATLRFGEVQVLFEPVDAGAGSAPGTVVFRAPAAKAGGRPARSGRIALLAGAALAVVALLATLLFLL